MARPRRKPLSKRAKKRAARLRLRRASVPFGDFSVYPGAPTYTFASRNYVYPGGVVGVVSTNGGNAATLTLNVPNRAGTDVDVWRDPSRGPRAGIADFVQVGVQGGNFVQQTTSNVVQWSDVVQVSGVDSAVPATPHRITIESLDQGLTWHAADTMEPCVRRADGTLVMGTQACGAAPACMVAGSGTYSFQVPHRAPTQDEIAAWRVEHARKDVEMHRQQQERLEHEERVEQRAEGLLLSHLDQRERREHDAFGGILVWSQHGNIYWIEKNRTIRLDKRGIVLQSYCIHTVDPLVPGDDNMLAKKLLLETDEEAFLRTANPRSPYKGDARLSRDHRTEQAKWREQQRQQLLAYVPWILAPGLIFTNVNGVTRPLCG